MFTLALPLVLPLLLSLGLVLVLVYPHHSKSSPPSPPRSTQAQTPTKPPTPPIQVPVPAPVPPQTKKPPRHQPHTPRSAAPGVIIRSSMSIKMIAIATITVRVNPCPAGNEKLMVTRFLRRKSRLRMRCLVCICRMRVGVKMSVMRLMRMCRRRRRRWWVFISSSRHTLRDRVGKEDGRLLSAYFTSGLVGD